MNIPKMEAEIQSVTILEPPNRAWYSKMIEYFKRNRNQVEPVRFQLEHCEFFKVAPRRTLRVLKPELKSGHYYEAQSSSERPESINDNFYARWARRPHPSGNCRCSFRQSTNSSRLSSHEEKIISQEIQRIRTSLCEAEKSGRNIEELEKSLTVDLTQLQLPSNDKTQETESQRNSINDNTNKKQSNGTVTTELLAECTKKKIVKDLDRYISDLLDEILNDTIKAIAKADNPFNRERKKSTTIASTQPQATTSFDISFAFHNSDDGNQKVNDSKDKIVSDELNAEDKGYINKGYLGSTSDPDALDFHLRPRMNGNAILENADCIDSGINSVETIELQPEQEQNLEQSLIDIIDAKLGGTSIGKSLENLGMEIDATDDAKISEAAEPTELRMPNDVILEKKTILSTEAKKSTTGEKKVTIKESPVFPAEERTSKSLDDAIEEPFNSLRLEFNKRDVDASKQSDGKQSTNVTFKVNKTMSVIRKRITTRLGNSRRKSKNNNNDNNTLNKSCSSSKSSTRASLELEDYRKRFPVPDTNRHRFSDYDDIHEISDEVTLRNRNRKPMIVFLHGFGSSAESFGHQLQYFANLGYPCIAPDLLGHGVSSASNRRKDYHFDKLLKDLETVLQHYAFKPGQKCVLVAHNYGCSFATALANKYSSNVHQLVLISGGGPTPLAPPAIEGPAHCCLRASLAPFLVCGIHRGILYSARGRQHPYCGDELHEDQWPSHMRHVLCGMSWPEGDYVFHRRICTPTLLVHGLRDDKVSLVQECQMERTMLKVYLEAIPAAGHMPMTDCPEQLNHMIHCFIDLWKNKKW